jgi:hypothetical protein
MTVPYAQPLAAPAPAAEPRRNRTRDERVAMVAQAMEVYDPENFPPKVIRALAKRHGVTKKMIKRAIKEACQPEPEPRAFQPFDELLVRIAMHHGVIAPAYRELLSEQLTGRCDWGLPSYPTVHRAVSADPWLMATLKEGPEALDRFLLAGVYEAPFPNAVAAGDETKITLRCRYGGDIIEDVRLFAVGDDHSRAITAHAVYVGAVTGELTASVYLAACLGRELSVADLRAHGIDAVGAVLLGGVPDLYILDNAQANLCHVMGEAAMLAGSTLRFARPHIAADKGKLERCFGTIKGSLAAVPGWTKGAQSHPADGHESRPYAMPSDADLPTLEAVIATIDAVIEDYNWNHVVSTTGQTPIARWVEGLAR